MERNEKIIGDELLLMAYVAGDLEGGELAQLEVRLASDFALKERASQLQNDYRRLMHTVGETDTENRASTRAALRNVNQLMLQWQGNIRPSAAPPVAWGWRPPMWSYAAAAMIALFVGFCFWWANNSPNERVVEVPTTEAAPEVAAAQSLSDAPTYQPPVEMPLAFQDISSDNSDRLSDMEKDVVALSQDEWSVNNYSGDTNQ